MTAEERLNRIEHVTAALAEERRKDREEYRQLGRDTQRQITETNDAVARLAHETRNGIARLTEQIGAADERAQAAEPGKPRRPAPGRIIRRPAPARGHCPRRLHQTAPASLRRADFRAGPRNDGG